MRATINVEFTDEELRNYLEDAGRRWAVNTVHQVIKGLSTLKFDPNTMTEFARSIAGAFGSKGPQADPGPTAGAPTHGFKDVGVPPCARVEQNVDNDEEWGCHVCGVINGLHRSACRRCGHERCDVVAPPPPPPPPIDPSVQ